MTLERLTAIAVLCMILTGFGVYMLTDPRTVSSVDPTVPSSSGSTASAPTTARAVPPVQSDPPSSREWSEARTVDVKGAPPLNCVAKVLRDWLRVACEGVNDTGGRPKDARIVNAKLLRTDVGSTGISHAAWSTPHGAAYTAASSSITSLVCPFVEGVNIEAQFDWTDKRAALVVDWPAGTPEPKLKARFRPT